MSRVDLDRASRAIEEFLAALGRPIDSDPELRETGRRVAEAFALDMLSGYTMDPVEILRDGTSARAPGTVLVTGIATTAICPHHLLPATGVVHVGYEPDGRVVGLGSLGKLVQCYARRLVLQEDLGQQIADALVTHLGAKAAGCIVDLEPSCMIARGSRQHGAHALTTAWAGDATDRFRHELLALAGRPG